MKAQIFAIILASFLFHDVSHAAYPACNTQYTYDEDSPQCIISNGTNAQDSQAYFYSFYSKYWKDSIHTAYCTVSGVDNPLDPSGVIGGDLELWPYGGEANYSSNYAFSTDIIVGPQQTLNVYITNKAVNPPYNVVFGAFRWSDGNGGHNSVMRVNCNPPSERR
ncbi:hypothetical protein CAL12_27930 [Bordetella genomosp. 8]|uniref:Secreted protein n=1 Tax=Bordetella genomosp. 8 TaxID=1416806 RepID=A0A1W6YT61_9BORD|nr:hypothetical protein [Bordetella genomosp. 8]ARP84267.1 hypothetical protein CAL12_27930 [Bordetella genomosp. 8]